MHILKREECSPFMESFRELFFNDEIDGNLDKVYLSVFDKWLNREEFESKIKNASLNMTEEYNSRRREVFNSVFRKCYFLNQDDKQYYAFSDEDEFTNLLNENFNDSEDFLIVSGDSCFAIQTGYDYTDYFYFIGDFSKESVKSVCLKEGVYILDAE